MPQTITETYDQTYREVKDLLKRAKAVAKQNKAKFEHADSSDWDILGDLQKLQRDLEWILKFNE